MKILVTGANGYLGQGIVMALLNKGHHVVATDIAVDNIDKRADIVKADLFSIENPYKYFFEPEVVLHLAWRKGFVHNDASHINDLPMHFAFVKNMVELGINRIAIMGSMHEIGFYEGCVDENTPCKPLSLYGIAKNALRDIATILTKEKGVQLQWLRGYYIVGNSEFGSSIFSKITQAVKNGDKEFPFTSGQNQYDFLKYDDFCNQVASVVQQSEINGIINICSGKPEKLADCVERFIEENHYDIKLLYGKYPDRIYDSKALWGNDKKIQTVLNNL
ncbi:MAG: NAD-dependent epimerase/dehydratase family protein [Bacteroidales bacterium]|nr:NAD-dependent epimerase/dehydratase family protein [Clostridium sp.]MCM1203293.1 NAD-dependent epimerase/dehydratase family protein [Bacteroidales bacterium]